MIRRFWQSPKSKSPKMENEMENHMDKSLEYWITCIFFGYKPDFGNPNQTRTQRES